MTTPNPFKQAIDQLRLQAGISNENYAARTTTGDHDGAKEAYDHAVSCNCAANFLEAHNPAEIGAVMPEPKAFLIEVPPGTELVFKLKASK